MFLVDNINVMVENFGSKFITVLEDEGQDNKRILSMVKTTPCSPTLM